MAKKIIKEACVESLEQALDAAKKGAHRIELCDRLDLGGTTPEEGLVFNCLALLKIPTKVMIRPRGGDFVYTDAEIQEMLESISKFKSIGVTEMVLGVLNNNQEIDSKNLQVLCEAAGECDITFHKAIDLVPDLASAVKTLKKFKAVKSILSSGQAPTAEEGVDQLKKLKEYCGKEIKLIVAGKVTSKNMLDLSQRIGAREYHGTKIVS